MTVCVECGGESPLYHGYKVDVCPKCARARIDRYFRGAVA